MVVDVVLRRHVELHRDVLVVPEHVFDLAHFLPGRAAVFAADTHVLPASAVTCNDKHCLGMFELDHKGPVGGVALWITRELDARFFRDLEHQNHPNQIPVPCTQPTGKNTAPAIKKPQEAVLRQVTTCVSQDRMTQPTRTNGSSSLIVRSPAGGPRSVWRSPRCRPSCPPCRGCRSQCGRSCARSSPGLPTGHRRTSCCASWRGPRAVV